MKRKSVLMHLACAGLALRFGLIGYGFLNTTRKSELKSENQTVDLESASTTRVGSVVLVAPSVSGK